MVNLFFYYIKMAETLKYSVKTKYYGVPQAATLGPLLFLHYDWKMMVIKSNLVLEPDPAASQWDAAHPGRESTLDRGPPWTGVQPGWVASSTEPP